MKNHEENQNYLESDEGKIDGVYCHWEEIVNHPEANFMLGMLYGRADISRWSFVPYSMLADAVGCGLLFLKVRDKDIEMIKKWSVNALHELVEKEFISEYLFTDRGLEALLAVS